MLLKKTVYDKLVAKLDNIDTSDFALNTKYNIDKAELENKISLWCLVKKTNCNIKITELENKIPDISNLAAKTVLTTAENKRPSVSNLVEKQAITQKLLILKINLRIIIMANILILQSLIN